jgi:hypothetical protein
MADEASRFGALLKAPHARAAFAAFLGRGTPASS